MNHLQELHDWAARNSRPVQVQIRGAGVKIISPATHGLPQKLVRGEWSDIGTLVREFVGRGTSVIVG